jgi:hypothetical protein
MRNFYLFDFLKDLKFSQSPYDDAAVKRTWGANSFINGVYNFYTSNFTFVNFLSWLKLFQLLSNLPESDFTICSATKNVFAVTSEGQACYSSIFLSSRLMSIIKNPIEFSTLWQKCSNFTISPTWNKTFSVWHKFTTITRSVVKLRSLHKFYSEKLFLIIWWPKSYLISATTCKNRSEVIWIS